MGRARLRDGPARQLPVDANLRRDWNNHVHGSSKLRSPNAKKFLQKLPEFGHTPSKILGEKSVKNIDLNGPQITLKLSYNVTHKTGILYCCKQVSLELMSVMLWLTVRNEVVNRISDAFE
jgi:hypothetical protein